MTGHRVKPLVWEDDSDHWHPETRWRAKDCFGEHYEIELSDGVYTLSHKALMGDIEADALAEAKAAAQADYEARILSALEPQDAPAVAGVEIPAGYTPGPWWTDARYDGREMGCPIIAARTDAGPLPGNPTRGMVAFASALLNTDARRCEANARLIALAPAMAEELVALRAEVERLRSDCAASTPPASQEGQADG